MQRELAYKQSLTQLIVDERHTLRTHLFMAGEPWPIPQVRKAKDLLPTLIGLSQG